MSKTKKPETQRTPLDVQICKMINESGMSLNAVAVAAGVPQPVLYRFVHGEQRSITLQNAERICAFFEVTLTAPKRRQAKGK